MDTHDKLPGMMNMRNEIICKPFKKHHDEQLKLVTSFDWIDFSALSDIKEVITGILSDKNAGSFMTEERISIIAELTEKRIQNLMEIANKGDISVKSSDKSDDLTENIAADYR